MATGAAQNGQADLRVGGTAMAQVPVNRTGTGGAAGPSASVVGFASAQAVLGTAPRAGAAAGTAGDVPAWVLEPVREGAKTYYVDRATGLAYVMPPPNPSAIARHGREAAHANTPPLLYGSVGEDGVVHKSVALDVFSRLSEYLSHSRTTLPHLFQQLDANHDGVLSRDEIGVLLGQIAPELSPGEREHVFAAFAALDGDYNLGTASGETGVSLHEFQMAVRQAQEAATSLHGAATKQYGHGEAPAVFEKINKHVRSDLRRAKQLFDALDVHNRGYLTPRGVVRLLNQLVPNGMSPEERRYAVAAIGAHDRNGDGRISFGEFCKAMRVLRPTIRSTYPKQAPAPGFAGFAQKDVPGAPFLHPTGPVVAQAGGVHRPVSTMHRALARPLDWDVFSLIDEHMRTPNGEHVFLKMFGASADYGSLPSKTCAEMLHEWLPVDVLKGHVRMIEAMLALEAPFLTSALAVTGANFGNNTGSIAAMAQHAALGGSHASAGAATAGNFTLKALMRAVNESYECARHVKSTARPAGGAENPAARAARAVLHAINADPKRALALFEQIAIEVSGGLPPSVATSMGNATRTLGDADARAMPPTSAGAFAALLEPRLSLMQRRLVCTIAASTDTQGAGQLRLSFDNLRAVLTAAAGNNHGMTSSGAKGDKGKVASVANAASAFGVAPYQGAATSFAGGLVHAHTLPNQFSDTVQHAQARGGGKAHQHFPAMMEPEDVIAYAIRKNATLRDDELARALKAVAARRGDHVDVAAIHDVDKALNAALLRAGQASTKTSAFNTVGMGTNVLHHASTNHPTTAAPNPFADLDKGVGKAGHHHSFAAVPKHGATPVPVYDPATNLAMVMPDMYRYHGPTGMLQPRFAVDAAQTAGKLGEDTFPIPVKEMEELDLYHRWTRQRREACLQQYDLEQQRKLARAKEQKANDLAASKLLYEIDMREKKLQDNLEKVALALSLKEKETAKLEDVKDGKPKPVTPDELKERVVKAMDAQKSIISHYQGLDRRRNLDVPYAGAYLQPQGSDEKRYPRPDVSYGMQQLEAMRQLAYDRGVPIGARVPPPGVAHYGTPDGGIATAYPPAYAYGMASPNEYARMLGMARPFLDHPYPPPPQHTDVDIVGAQGGAMMHPFWQRVGYPPPDDLPNRPDAGSPSGGAVAAT